MADDLDHLDDLPKRDANHVTEEKAEAAFQRLLTASGRFILQRGDRKDYGTDCEIEVVDQEQATNVRIHVQLKGSERPLNADGSLSIEVSRSNLNYLLIHPHSFYAAYHIPTSSLRICLAETVLRQYEHAGKNWTHQQSLTVNFTDELTNARLDRLAALARSAARAARDRRIEQTRAAPGDVAGLLRRGIPDIHVPDDPAVARHLLAHLYDQDADTVISAAFDRFAAVLGVGNEAMGPAYMAEVNLGMAGLGRSRARIEDAVAFFRKQLDVGRYERGGLHYTIGNALSALGREEDAKTAYEAAIADPAFANAPDLASQAHKNLGTSFERLGDEKRAVEHYRDALRLNPHLPEAHNALAQFYMRKGEWKDALAHLDQAVFTDPIRAKASGVAGWRANALFNMGEGSAAFREINSLLVQADGEPWIWPFFARLVASFGRTTTENARQALGFWHRYVGAHPDSSSGRRELLLATLYLRSEGQDVGRTFAEFRGEFDRQIEHVGDRDEAAFLWDRLGHWAQDEADWAEAERCFRRAYDLAGGHYGYCLGTALNFLGRFEESLPILREQAEDIQPDAMSWFQLGAAYGDLGQSAQAIDAYEKALSLEPNYDLAMFNLGGVYWNSGEKMEALRIWKVASERFPDHELAAKLQRDMPVFFPPDPDR
ncbi:tetratricopeptide (TPR) repeat protein [Bradyrhizobium japonicum]|uniref:tetratricopeptide repeat protein n=1 Tax=Bradyrhizobium japonicum TaxID=375 RepID=UPI0021677CA8|nr:tetratricopeptide repeat protein [Bradyrhizobium japonicum]MCS3502283.1 tetratricopeptide (TPR) repeat protein [Bradyrhizobium japonicum]MCS3965004.1 tetratricopeptide (TPR) repeat protein [Bradyrhizobium japonicum]MCS3997311.1 tetratricopeptide (TPR) repeat protein [Bradyrhizobium japonicum]